MIQLFWKILYLFSTAVTFPFALILYALLPMKAESFEFCFFYFPFLSNPASWVEMRHP